MAKKAGYILTGALTFMCCVSMWAQQKGNAKSQANAAKDTALLARKKASRPLVYLGTTDFSGGIITRNDFLNNVKQGITSKDETGNLLKVVGFNFIYAERRLFEDSAGNMAFQTDYSYEACIGDTLNPIISSSMNNLLKGGDTVFFSQVMVQRKIGNEIDTIMGRELKCVITKVKQ